MLLFKKKKHRMVYTMTVGVLLLIVAILHLIRAIQGWTIMISDVIIPIWFSWVVAILLGYLAYRGFTRKV